MRCPDCERAARLCRTCEQLLQESAQEMYEALVKLDERPDSVDTDPILSRYEQIGWMR